MPAGASMPVQQPTRCLSQRLHVAERDSSRRGGCHDMAAAWCPAQHACTCDVGQAPMPGSGAEGSSMHCRKQRADLRARPSALLCSAPLRAACTQDVALPPAARRMPPALHAITEAADEGGAGAGAEGAHASGGRRAGAWPTDSTAVRNAGIPSPLPARLPASRRLTRTAWASKRNARTPAVS